MSGLRTDAPIIVVPDTHGHLALFERLVAYCRKEGYLQDHRLVCIGDYFDRGPNVRGLVEYCISLHDEGHVFTKGNHEYAVEMAIESHSRRAAWIARWARGFEDHTLASYGVSRPRSDMPAAWRWAADGLRDAMPRSHRSFLATMPPFFETDTCICIHAGVLPEEMWSHQRDSLCHPNDAQRIRGPAQLFSHELARTTAHRTEKCVISGHVAYEKPHIWRKRIFLHCGTDIGGPLVAWISDIGKCIAVHPRRSTTLPRSW